MPSARHTDDLFVQTVAKNLWSVYVDSLALDEDSLAPDDPLPLPPPFSPDLGPSRPGRRSSSPKILQEDDEEGDEDAAWGQRQRQKERERSDHDRMRDLVDGHLSSSSSDSSSSDSESSSSRSASSTKTKSSNNSGHSDAGEGGGKKRKKAKKPRVREIDPRIHIRTESTLCVLYIACLCLKLPVMMHDLCRYALSLPFTLLCAPCASLRSS